MLGDVPVASVGPTIYLRPLCGSLPPNIDERGFNVNLEALLKRDFLWSVHADVSVFFRISHPRSQIPDHGSQIRDPKTTNPTKYDLLLVPILCTRYVPGIYLLGRTRNSRTSYPNCLTVCVACVAKITHPNGVQHNNHHTHQTSHIISYIPVHGGHNRELST